MRVTVTSCRVVNSARDNCVRHRGPDKPGHGSRHRILSCPGHSCPGCCHGVRTRQVQRQRDRSTSNSFFTFAFLPVAVAHITFVLHCPSGRNINHHTLCLAVEASDRGGRVSGSSRTQPPGSDLGYSCCGESRRVGDPGPDPGPAGHDAVSRSPCAFGQPALWSVKPALRTVKPAL